MDISEIVAIRLANHQLSVTNFKSPHEVVSWMGAMQAQDFSMCKWAVGIRMPGITDAKVEEEFNKSEFVRIHILRPTWHIVSKNDVHWMRELSTPRLKSLLKSHDRSMGFNDDSILKANHIIAKALKNDHLTKQEIGEVFVRCRMPLNDKQLNQALLHAELDGIICNGYARSKYCLLDEKNPKKIKLNKEEAIHRLASRYFSSHGPATVQDFSWWSGMSITEARKAMNYIRHEFIFETINSQTYVFKYPSINYKLNTDIVHFLPNYDEYFIGYRDRKDILPQEHLKKVIVNAGAFKATIIKNGKIIGTWRKTINRNNRNILFEYEYFYPEDNGQAPLYARAASSMEKFFKEV